MSQKFKGIAAKAFLIFFAILSVAPPSVYAYIDPGMGAMIWQILLAAFVGAIFFIKRVKFWIIAMFNWIWIRITGNR